MLPSALVDYTLSRLSSPRSLTAPLFSRPGQVRYLANAALALKTPDNIVLPDSAPNQYGLHRRRARLNHGVLKVRSPTQPPKNISTQLARRVRELEKVINAKDAELDPPIFSEEDLLTFYEDILAHPEAREKVVPKNTGMKVDNEIRYQENLAIVESVELRLRSSNHQSSGLAAALRGVSQVPAQGETSQEGATPVYRRVLNQVDQILTELERATPQFPSTENALPILLLTMAEWDALFRSTLHVRDVQRAEKLTELMKRSHLEVPEGYVNDILELYVEDGDCIGLESSLPKLVSGPPNERQRHLHIKVHLRAAPSQSIPSSALKVLHAYENQALPPTMKTYTSVIRHLFSVHDPVSQAHAWDIFSHMRYVAHPTPDVFLYNQMIRACASPFTSRSSDPERALDLWTEMTVDQRITPEVGTWNAVILACARSGRKTYVNEAFRLAREMLDSHRDAYGSSAFTPNLKTFCALLEGAKRIGDLARARWILAEMVRSHSSDVEVDEEVMMHIFHVYASYRPPFKRSLARVVEEKSSELSNPENSIHPTETLDETLSVSKSISAFTQVPPQTHTEVVSEIEILFDRILFETGIRTDKAVAEDVFRENGKFSGVKLTTRLVNSYLSAHYKHNSLVNSRNLFWNIFEMTGVERNSRTYTEALERCTSSKKPDREMALRFAEELFSKWHELEKSDSDISARTKERAHVAFIRVLTLADRLDRAMVHLRSFVDRYPASSIRDQQTIVKLAMRSTRTSLVGDRPLVRLTSPAEVPDSRVPPLLTWKDLEVLHHRLIIAGRREKDIAYIKYVCKAYEWALRVRRDETMRAKPGTRENREKED
ncbi:hypothetical protein BDP27DRAFT_1287915 [Rhodocollybia butyracea]|uniref:Pentatricopeptide repeat-containing protein n=1 Tax=Rhodocollybia butyracea TaxID=206335 RepID=A0A9P5UCT2_9AGAR|nr:hypothetical protein BDP27DRAFT_1287915 [Rhodocollybia butyracea]